MEAARVVGWAPGRPLSAAQLWPQEAAVSLCRAVSPPDLVITERGDGVEQHPVGARPLTCRPGGLGAQGRPARQVRHTAGAQ